MDPAHVYEQVFAQVAGQHGVLDLLCVTRTRRLAISRIKGHGKSRSSFAGRSLLGAHSLGISTRAILRATAILIAPALRFHPTTGALQRYLSRDREIIRVGRGESWRRGLRVMFRQ